MTMSTHPALVLNADFRPVSYFPLSLQSWQDAVHAVFSERVAVVAEYDAWARSPSTQIRLPSVVALRKYQRAPRRVTFTRFNVFLRDRFTCQYCGEALPSSALTFEHVIPRSRGGQTTWANIVTACVPCNTGKGNSPRIKPRHLPTTPSGIGRRSTANFLIITQRRATAPSASPMRCAGPASSYGTIRRV